MNIINEIILKDEVREEIRKKIYEYDGGEIFFGCLLNEYGEIYDVKPICYGNDTAVLAPYDFAKQFNAILHNHPSGVIKPSENDLVVASYLQNEGIGFLIVNNKVTKVNIVVPPVLLKKEKKIDLNFIEEFFKKDGILSQKKENFEYREGQLEMSLQIAEAINNNEIAVIEAGTGIGKSLAYLIPAILWVSQNNEKIVISTNTINLQNQLLQKDIPFAKRALGIDVKTALVKGRRNYLCKLKLYNFSNELDFEEKIEEINQILRWSNITSTGDIDELNFIPDNYVWDKVASEVDFCTGRHCIFFSSCFYQLSRRKASEANLLVTNHHILFADIQIKSLGKGVEENLLLPPYKKLIIDEAHNIEKNASSFFSFSFSKAVFFRYFSYLKRKKGNAGILVSLFKKLSKENNTKVIEEIITIIENLLTEIDIIQEKALETFNKITNYIYLNKKNFIEDQFIIKKVAQIRIKNEEWESAEFKENFINNLNEISIYLEKISEYLNELIEKFEKSKLTDRYEYDVKLLKSYQNKLNSIILNITNILGTTQDEQELIKWIEIENENNYSNIKINCTPLYVNKILAQNLFSVFDSIILTSATLTINKTFEFFFQSAGLSFVKEREIITKIIPSPFDYENRVLLVIPEYFPSPNENNYNEMLNEYLKKTIILTEGSCFVLFTSHHQLRKSFEDVGSYLNQKGLPCYRQGLMEKTTLLNTFINEVKSTLFATNSFWEGVDAPGETLRYVILAKLPFNMPTEPVEEAKIEDMEKKGINSFMNYILPNAIIKFRQGFGRLMRKKDDYGIVAILDSRILNKQYGQLFFYSLPKCKVVTGDLEKISKEIVEHVNKYRK